MERISRPTAPRLDAARHAACRSGCTWSRSRPQCWRGCSFFRSSRTRARASATPRPILRSSDLSGANQRLSEFRGDDRRADVLGELVRTSAARRSPTSAQWYGDVAGSPRRHLGQHRRRRGSRDVRRAFARYRLPDAGRHAADRRRVCMTLASAADAAARSRRCRARRMGARSRRPPTNSLAGIRELQRQ